MSCGWMERKRLEGGGGGGWLTNMEEKRAQAVVLPGGTSLGAVQEQQGLRWRGRGLQCQSLHVVFRVQAQHPHLRPSMQSVLSMLQSVDEQNSIIVLNDAGRVQDSGTWVAPPLHECASSSSQAHERHALSNGLSTRGTPSKLSSPAASKGRENHEGISLFHGELELEHEHEGATARTVES